MLDTEEEMLGKWKMIPDDTDILITHGPPYGNHNLETNQYKLNFIITFRYSRYLLAQKRKRRMHDAY